MNHIRSTEAVSVGDTYEVEAIRLNDDGDGVAIADGLTVFIPNLLVSEKATVEIVSVHRRFARGEVLQRHNDSGKRVTPPSLALLQSGSCPLLHLEYDEQLRHKEAVVAYAIRGIEQETKPSVLPIIGMEYPYRYRNQVQVPVEWDNLSKRIRYGYFAKDSHTIIESDMSILETKPMEQTIAATVGFLTELGSAICESVHHIIVRESHTTGQQMVILSVVHEHAKLRDSLKEFFAARGQNPIFEQLVTVGFTIQPNRTGPVWGAQVEIVAGSQAIVESIAELDFLVSPRSFFQVNTIQAAKLYESAIHFANLSGNERVLDAYCGTGTIALALSKAAKSVVGIETIAAAIRDANQNAAHNHIENVEFITGEVEKVLPRLIKQGHRFDVIVLDPPRKGVHPDVIDAVLQANPKRVVYVSCNPATFGRDAMRLVSGGYQLDVIQPVDMFPQTSHVECCALLVRK